MSKKKVTATRYLNPPFDPRMLRIGVPSYGGGRLARGRIVQADAPREGVHFLYNPISVTANHSLNLDATTQPEAMVKQPGGVTFGYMVNQGEVSVSLLYDRTYELWDHSKRHTLAGKYGCYADVLAYYRMLNITGTGVTQSKQTDPTGGLGPGAFNSGKTWSTLFPVNPLAPLRVYLIIGDKLRYFGVISGFAVTYSHWNRDMIPTRCEIDLSLSFQPDPNHNPKVTTKKGGKRHKVGPQANGSATPGPFKGGLGNPGGLRP